MELDRRRRHRRRTPFADLFAQLAGRVVGVVVNISTTRPRRRPARPAEAAAKSPGSQLDEVFRDFFGDEGQRARTGRAAGSPRSARALSSIRRG